MEVSDEPEDSIGHWLITPPIPFHDHRQLRGPNHYSNLRVGLNYNTAAE
jgi:hypothetical protein